MPKKYTVQDGRFFPGRDSTSSKTLPPGVYECEVTAEGQPYLQPFKMKNDEIIDIPGSTTESLRLEVDKFWSDEVSEKFKQYGLLQKRGYLLYGKPGTGKTLALTSIATHVIEKYGAVVLFNPHPGTVKEFGSLIREIEPDKKLVIMWEEFDEILGRSEGSILSLLDGEIQLENVLYLATTNYISKIPGRIKNRPSRFSNVVEFIEPNEEMRRIYLDSKLHDSDREHLEPLVQASEGLVLDQLKDLVVSVCCFNIPIHEAVSKIQTMQADNSFGVSDYNEHSIRQVLGDLAKEMSHNRTKLKPLVPKD